MAQRSKDTRVFRTLAKRSTVLRDPAIRTYMGLVVGIRW